MIETEMEGEIKARESLKRWAAISSVSTASFYLTEGKKLRSKIALQIRCERKARL